MASFLSMTSEVGTIIISILQKWELRIREETPFIQGTQVGGGRAGSPPPLLHTAPSDLEPGFQPQPPPANLTQPQAGTDYTDLTVVICVFTSWVPVQG